MGDTFAEILEGKGREHLPWDDQAKQIIDALKALGVRKEDVETNTYIFQFPYGDLVVQMANHGKSVSGSIQKRPALEDGLVEHAETILSSGLFGERELKLLRLLREHEYRKFSYRGDPATLMSRVIDYANAPLIGGAENGYIAVDTFPR